MRYAIPPREAVPLSRSLRKRLLVRDSGKGISAESLPKLFTRFWRAGGNQEGTELCLSICREIAQALDWDLMARNIDPGMEFVVSFGQNKEAASANSLVARD